MRPNYQIITLSHYQFIDYLPPVGLILNIDTAVQSASLCLADGKRSIGKKINPSQKDHASWLHPAINTLMQECGFPISSLEAVAVSAGPGSYTGLRVGMATAKGICYVLNIPLITVNTLQMMAAASQNSSQSLLCPMIDARRMEVFTAVYDRNLNEILPSSNIILDEKSFSDLLEHHQVLFFGNGSIKFKSLVKHENADFKTIESTAENMVKLSATKFGNQNFSDLAYSEPFYGKDFHSFVKQSYK